MSYETITRLTSNRYIIKFSVKKKKMLLLKWDLQRLDSIFFLVVEQSRDSILWVVIKKWQKWKLSRWEQFWVLTPQINWSTPHEAWAWFIFPWLHMIKIWKIYHPSPDPSHDISDQSLFSCIWHPRVIWRLIN